MSLQPLKDGASTIHHDAFAVSGLRIGTRTNVLPLPDGTWAVHAPGPLDEAEQSAIRALGPVQWILAPNQMHHLFLGAAMAAFPEATVVATPSLSKKAPAVRIGATFDKPLPSPLAAALEVEHLDGCPLLDEYVLFDPRRRLLLGVDLAFNLHRTAGFTRFAMWLNNANDRFCVTRLGRAQYVSDAVSAGRSVQRMVDRWDIESIAVAHGDVLANEGRSALREAWSFAMP